MPKIGVVIGTYGSVGYVRLQLESRKLYWPDVPVMIHDDNSPDRDELMRLCNEYGVEYFSPESRLDSTGDMSCIIEGIDWAKKNKIDIVVKMSRRFLLIHGWDKSLQVLAHNTQYPTYTGHCAEYMYGCRSECVAFHVDSWIDSEPLKIMRKSREKGVNPSSSMELWYYKQSKKIFDSMAPMQIKAYRSVFKIRSNAIACGTWPIMGYSRHTSSPGLIWHNADFPEEYFYCARSYGFDDISLDELRWIYEYDPKDRIKYPEPPLASPRIGCVSSEIEGQKKSFESINLRPVEKTSPFFRIMKQADRKPNLNSWLFEQRTQNRIERGLFDIIRWIRTLAWQPYVISRTFFDTINVSNIWRKISVNNAVAEPRHENFSRFICQKSVEHPGQILTFGPHPTGLVRHAALKYGNRIHFSGITECLMTGPSDAATAHLNHWANLTLYTPSKPDPERKWIEDLKNINFEKISLVLLNIPGQSQNILDALSKLIQRDVPQIIVCMSNTAKSPADNLPELMRDFEKRGYACSMIWMDGDCDGVFRPFNPEWQYKRKAIYAWKTV
jgi:hypothetical protein